MKLCPLSSPGKHGTECVWYYPAFAAFTVVALLVRKTTFRPRKLTGQLRLAGDFDFLSLGKYSRPCSCSFIVCVCTGLCVCVCVFAIHNILYNILFISISSIQISLFFLIIYTTQRPTFDHIILSF